MADLSETGWLVAGLGNPGPEYERTRHNVGFMLIDRLADDLQTTVKREECRALIGRANIGGTTVELVKPQTFMNLSGNAIGCLLSKPGRSANRLIVISDDLALPIGRIRIRRKGSHGGQNGLRSIIDHLKTEEFIRLRIGIAPEHPIGNARDFVLQNFSKTDAETVRDVIVTAADAVRSIVTDGVDKAMSNYNADPAVIEQD